nr:pheromone alpha factor receptor [Quercus suber]
MHPRGPLFERLVRLQPCRRYAIDHYFLSCAFALVTLSYFSWDGVFTLACAAEMSYSPGSLVFIHANKIVCPARLDFSLHEARQAFIRPFGSIYGLMLEIRVMIVRDREHIARKHGQYRQQEKHKSSDGQWSWPWSCPLQAAGRKSRSDGLRPKYRSNMHRSIDPDIVFDTFVTWLSWWEMALRARQWFACPDKRRVCIPNTRLRRRSNDDDHRVRFCPFVSVSIVLLRHYTGSQIGLSVLIASCMTCVDKVAIHFSQLLPPFQISSVRPQVSVTRTISTTAQANYPRSIAMPAAIEWTSADMASIRPNSTFDGFRQNFVLLLPDGKTQFIANLEDFNLLQASQLNQGIIYGAQIGITALLLVIMLMMTKPDKRRSLVFVLNSLALLIILVRTIMAACLLGGPFFNFYIFELGWYPHAKTISHYIRISVATESLGVLVNCSIFASLMLQVHVICCTLTRTKHKIVMGFCGLVILMVCSIRLTLAVMNSKWSIVGLRTTTMAQWDTIQRMASASNIATVTCIATFSAIFNTKLVMAMMIRRKLKIQQYGPMQIIFVMGLQTMFVPLIIGIVGYFITPGSQLATFVDTSVAIFLPLSGMWASANTNNAIAANAANRRAVPVGASDQSCYYSHPSSGKRLVSNCGTDASSFSDDKDLEKGPALPPSSYNTVPDNGRHQHQHQQDADANHEGTLNDRSYQVRLD